MVRKVISGGQIGADIAGLRAAAKLGIETGGYAPKDFQTRKGPNLELRDIYGLEDSKLPYAGRTELNVFHSDATMRLAWNFQSPGELCTAKWIRFHHKPSIDVLIAVIHPGVKDGYSFRMEPVPIARWLVDKKVAVLNVAGNADPVMEDAVEAYLTNVLTLVREYKG